MRVNIYIYKKKGILILHHRFHLIVRLKAARKNPWKSGRRKWDKRIKVLLIGEESNLLGKLRWNCRENWYRELFLIANFIYSKHYPRRNSITCLINFKHWTAEYYSFLFPRPNFFLLSRNILMYIYIFLSFVPCSTLRDSFHKVSSA